MLQVLKFDFWSLKKQVQQSWYRKKKFKRAVSWLRLLAQKNGFSYHVERNLKVQKGANGRKAQKEASLGRGKTWKETALRVNL